MSEIPKVVKAASKANTLPAIYEVKAVSVRKTTPKLPRKTILGVGLFLSVMGILTAYAAT